MGGLLAAVAASSCCVLPLLLGVAGAGTLGVGAALTPYRPYLIGLTAFLLGAAFYLAYRTDRNGSACGTTTADCCSSLTNAASKQRQAGRFGLWCVAAATAMVVAYPWIASLRAAGAMPAQVTAANRNGRVAVFAIRNMTCAECTVGIVDTLRKMPGVYTAEVDFGTKRATVRYDRARVNAAGLLEVIGRTGFTATEVAP